MAEPLPSESVTPESLRALLEQAFYQVKLDEDNDLIVSGAYTLIVRVMAEKVLRIWASFRLVEDLAVEQILGAINTFNARALIVKAYLTLRSQPGHALVFETDMSFDSGLIPANFIARLRAFEIIVLKAREFDEYTT